MYKQYIYSDRYNLTDLYIRTTLSSTVVKLSTSHPCVESTQEQNGEQKENNVFPWANQNWLSRRIFLKRVYGGGCAFSIKQETLEEIAKSTNLYCKEEIPQENPYKTNNEEEKKFWIINNYKKEISQENPCKTDNEEEKKFWIINNCSTATLQETSDTKNN